MLVVKRATACLLSSIALIGVISSGLRSEVPISSVYDMQGVYADFKCGVSNPAFRLFMMANGVNTNYVCAINSKVWVAAWKCFSIESNALWPLFTHNYINHQHVYGIFFIASSAEQGSIYLLERYWGRHFDWYHFRPPRSPNVCRPQTARSPFGRP